MVILVYVGVHLVNCRSTGQTIIAYKNTEAQFVAVDSTTRVVIWLIIMIEIFAER